MNKQPEENSNGVAAEENGIRVLEFAVGLPFRIRNTTNRK